MFPRFFCRRQGRASRWRQPVGIRGSFLCPCTASVGKRGEGRRGEHGRRMPDRSRCRRKCLRGHLPGRGGRAAVCGAGLRPVSGGCGCHLEGREDILCYPDPAGRHLAAARGRCDPAGGGGVRDGFPCPESALPGGARVAAAAAAGGPCPDAPTGRRENLCRRLYLRPGGRDSPGGGIHRAGPAGSSADGRHHTRDGGRHRLS